MSDKPPSFILLISKGILRDRNMRRRALFGIVLSVLFLLGLGFLVLDEWLCTHPVLFLLYWGACLWLTVTSLLLAFYDLLLVRRDAREERNRIKSQILGNDKDPQP